MANSEIPKHQDSKSTGKIPPLDRPYAKRGLYESFIRAAACLGWKRGRRVLVGLSGGRDSVVLLHLLLAAGFRAEAAHLNHRLRGAESRRDKKFVKNLCRTWGVPLATGAEAVAKRSLQYGLSLEDAARTARYRFLAQTAQQRKIRTVAVAHHLNDQAETVLMKILFGGGQGKPRGMAMQRSFSPPAWPGTKSSKTNSSLELVRPLLEIPADQVALYARQNKLPFCEDSSNRDLRHPRNWIRRRLLPYIEKGLRRNVVKPLARLGNLSSGG
ncbi:MAG: tRNA lysidine(34) synthetase TilS [Verrucomicrobiae bacterium]|nr:tRNA lysidine(34) synthetase TilS [Verrucomicrobiae bacterium]